MSAEVDIVERLQSKATDCHEVEAPLYLEAADLITFLRAGRDGANQRDAFEEWAQRDNRRLDALEHEERTPGNNHYYADDTTNHAYVGWCEAHRAGRDGALREAAEVADDMAAGQNELAEYYRNANTGQREAAESAEVAHRMCASAIRALLSPPRRP